jgi:hypothetical protein
MIEVLKREDGGPVSLNSLSVELSERFSIEENSVQIYAGTDPHFIEKEGSVTLRDDFSEVELPPLGETFGIFRMGKGPFVGRWTLRIEVGVDHLRGSGTPIPAGFARHVGAEFGETVLLETNEGPISCSWQKNRGSLSSIGAILQRWEAKEGDLIFLTSVSPGQAHFEHVRCNELPVDEEQRLLVLFGADLGTDIKNALVRAVGLSEEVDVTVLMRTLEERVRRHQSKEISVLLKSWARKTTPNGLIATCRDAVLAAFRSLEDRSGEQIFSVGEIYAEVKALTGRYSESTVSAFVTTSMCVQAPPFDGVKTDDLDRVGKGRYQLNRDG